MIPSISQFHNDFGSHGAKLHARALEVLSRHDAKTQACRNLLEQIPEATPSRIDLNRDCIAAGLPSDLSAAQRSQLASVLHGLKPWRKGPFNLFGIHIDSEWDSSLKWHRLADHLSPLTGRRILDVGSSNGYYLFRMAAADPRLILGIEPYRLYFFQYLAVQRFLNLHGVYSLPLQLEQLPEMPQWFDTIFCMGILYHRRSPLDTLFHLGNLLRPGGELVLETLIIEGDASQALFPRQRYARMRNVYFIPTVPCLENWLARAGFDNIRCVDITVTTTQEQRKTQWIDSDSLETFLNPENTRLTVEGYPAPVRAVIIAAKE